MHATFGAQLCIVLTQRSFEKWWWRRYARPIAWETKYYTESRRKERSSIQ